MGPRPGPARSHRCRAGRGSYAIFSPRTPVHGQRSHGGVAPGIIRTGKGARDGRGACLRWAARIGSSRAKSGCAKRCCARKRGFSRPASPKGGTGGPYALCPRAPTTGPHAHRGGVLKRLALSGVYGSAKKICTTAPECGDGGKGGPDGEPGAEVEVPLHAPGSAPPCIIGAPICGHAGGLNGCDTMSGVASGKGGSAGQRGAGGGRGKGAPFIGAQELTARCVARDGRVVVAGISGTIYLGGFRTRAQSRCHFPARDRFPLTVPVRPRVGRVSDHPPSRGGHAATRGKRGAETISSAIAW